MFQCLSVYLERIYELNLQLEQREAEIHKLSQKTRRAAERGAPPHSAPELEQLLRLPLAALEKELFLSRHEFSALVSSLDSSIAESGSLTQQLQQLQQQQQQGSSYILSLEADLQTATSEGEQLQKEFEWIVSLPPSAFASHEMLEWLRRDHEFDSDSELGLDISPETSPNSSNILLPDQIHPATRSTDPARSSSTGSTSSGVSSDLHSLVSPEPSLNKSKSPLPPLPPKPSLRPYKRTEQEEDCNSDTGLSSLNSSGEDPYSLDTLV